MGLRPGRGQIDLDYSNSDTLSSNSIDGNSISGIVGSPAGPYGCTVPYVPGVNYIGEALPTDGIEGHFNSGASGLSLYNNEATYHKGAGMSLDSAVTSVLVSTYDPSCVGCYVANVGSNAYEGIHFLGDTTGSIIFDGVEATGNGTAMLAAYGIAVENSTGGNGISVTFHNNACLVGNAGGRAIFGSNVSVSNFPALDTCPTH